MSLDFASLGFKAGLEIHQQLDTPKLFCRCGSALDEDERIDVSFGRELHPTASELGEVDPAAIAEARKGMRFEYVGARRSCCLVDMDEEPPHPVSREALDVALETALLLGAKPVDELHVMRKIVVDGSNTSGFQRTSLVATQGLVEAAEGPVRMATFCLEEDSARRLDRVGNVQRYRLDRLGIPLIEIATEPDLKSPAHAREVAEAIGQALRATGKVKRGIGTIRQDLNVSIRAGARVEIKGVQELRLIETAVAWEVQRQAHLVEIKMELAKRGAHDADYLRPIVDVGDVFAGTHAKMIAESLQKGGSAYAIGLPHLAGLLGKKGKEDPPPPRVGRELADYAKIKAGVKGLFHSDELPAYGITQREVDEVRARLSLAGQDAFVMVVESETVARVALEAARGRAAQLLSGVPEETRDMNPDGTSRYLRPLPGGARMYPETDVPPIRLSAERLASIKLPETWAAKRARLGREHPELSADQVTLLVKRGQAETFESLVQRYHLVKDTARAILEFEAAPRDALDEGLRGLAAGLYPREALAQVVAHVAKHDGRAENAVAALGLAGADKEALRAEIDAAIAANAEKVAAQGMRAQGLIMGPIMAKHRGKVAGAELSALIAERLQKWLDAR